MSKYAIHLNYNLENGFYLRSNQESINVRTSAGPHFTRGPHWVILKSAISAISAYSAIDRYYRHGRAGRGHYLQPRTGDGR